MGNHDPMGRAGVADDSSTFPGSQLAFFWANFEGISMWD
jgi:hypothetical protein